MPVTLAALLAGCGGNTGDSAAPTTTTATDAAPSSSTPAARLIAGRAVPALGFEARTPVASPFAATVPSTEPGALTTSAAEAVRTFVSSVLQGDAARAWALTSTADRDRLGYPQRISDQVAAMGWKAFTVSSTAADSVTMEVTQTPSISDIDGVIAATATVRVPTVLEAGVRRVVWSRRRIEQHFPDPSPTEDARAADAVASWVAARQRCDGSPTNQFAGGLTGVVGLADRLCRATGAATVGPVGDLDTMDEPEPVLDAFGGSAMQWARVVKVTSPVALTAVVAPRGTDWIVVAVARPSIADS